MTFRDRFLRLSSIGRRSLLAASVTLAAACGGSVSNQNPGQPTLPSAGPDGEYEASFPPPKQPETRSLLMVVSEDLHVDCRMPDPHFAFDEAKPKAQSEVALEALASCLQTDALEGKPVLLVGHADARGSDDYNDELALDRARQAAAILVESGVDADQILLTSLGEQSAMHAKDGYSHGYDRRVDVLILDRDRRPAVSGVVPYISLRDDAR